MNILFDGIAEHFKGKEYTNPRVQKNLEVLQLLVEATEPVTLNNDYKTLGSVKFLNRN